MINNCGGRAWWPAVGPRVDRRVRPRPWREGAAGRGNLDFCPASARLTRSDLALRGRRNHGLDARLRISAAPWVRSKACCSSGARGSFAAAPRREVRSSSRDLCVSCPSGARLWPCGARGNQLQMPLHWRLCRPRGCSMHAEGALPAGAAPVGLARPNVRGNAGPTVGRQARAADDNQHGCAGLLARRWASR